MGDKFHNPHSDCLLAQRMDDPVLQAQKCVALGHTLTASRASRELLAVPRGIVLQRALSCNVAEIRYAELLAHFHSSLLCLAYLKFAVWLELDYKL